MFGDEASDQGLGYRAKDVELPRGEQIGEVAVARPGASGTADPPFGPVAVQKR